METKNAASGDPLNPIQTILLTMVLRLRAEREEQLAWQIFREGAMRDPNVTLAMCDKAWAALKEKAERMFHNEYGHL